MMRTKEQIELENKRIKSEYGDLFGSVADILFRHDPVGINFEDNTDEYYPEARTILPRLKDCHSAQDVTSVVHEEFVKWFEPGTAGAKENYQLVAEEIWNRWQEARMNRTQA
jgi:hypothetical protein